MAMFWMTEILKQMSRPAPRSSRKRPNRARFPLTLEPLDARVMPAVVATFAGGTLSVFGDSQSNTIDVSRDAAGTILVNGGAVTVRGGTPTVANTFLIQVLGQGGDDGISLNEASGALPRANLFGGAGNDTLTGGSGSDQLFGQAGNDSLLGKGGIDFLFGGSGSDMLTGGTGDDQTFGEAGNDRMIWNPGEGSDLNEGGAGTDTVEVNGGNGAETFTITANGARVRFDRVTPAPFFLDIGTSENLVLNANGGDDIISAGNGLATLIQLSLDGGAGNDTITGGDGNDRLVGGDGNDVINGGRGNDTAVLGAGDDTFVWNPGDASDTVEGQAGNDTMVFNGANVNENITLSANGSRLRLFRNVGAVTMDTNEVENVNINALGGSDAITLDDLSATSVSQVNIDLGATPGANGGDSQSDTITVTGTNNADNVQVFGNGSGYVVAGLSAVVTVANSEGTLDNLQVNFLGGNDGFDASTLPAGVIHVLTVDGGVGDDTINGSQGADMLLGGDGNDLITGGRGDDAAFMGAGDDTFVWNSGDGSDTIEGQAGTDKMFFFGSDARENFDISANGARVRFFRDIGNVTMDLAGVEQIELRPLRGSDNVVVNDLTGTDLTDIELALRSPDGGPDGLPDTITVNGTQGNDNFGAAGDTGGLRVTGLHTNITIFDQDPTMDQLTLNGLGGNDVIDSRSLRADSVRFLVNGGDGDDTITGSDGSDLINGGRGNDVAFMGAGDDTFVWNPGDGSDTVEGQDGTDTMVFNGANVNEKIDFSANGSRVRLFRDVGNITMDMNGLEVVDLNALGGADTITVNDLTGTDVTDLNLSLGVNGAGDGQLDTVIINATTGDDAITVSGDATGVTAIGLAARVNISGAETTDQLTVNALAGDDVIEASGLSADAIHFTADGGDDDDVLIGGAGNDTLIGGAGDDVLIGGPGQDVLDGGTGDNILIQ
jgi:Ca2+-binding RTX toxin-like protein